eukprot:1857826-Rhodomonas_salina.3
MIRRNPRSDSSERGSFGVGEWVKFEISDVGVGGRTISVKKRTCWESLALVRLRFWLHDAPVSALAQTSAL